MLRIRDVYPGSRIPDLGSKNSNKREGWKKNCCHTLFCSHKFHKPEKFLCLNYWRKQFGPIFKELKNLLCKKLSLSSQKYGFGIPDPGVKKAPDPGSATQVTTAMKSRQQRSPLLLTSWRGNRWYSYCGTQRWLLSCRMSDIAKPYHWLDWWRHFLTCALINVMLNKLRDISPSSFLFGCTVKYIIQYFSYWTESTPTKK